MKRKYISKASIYNETIEIIRLTGITVSFLFLAYTMGEKQTMFMLYSGISFAFFVLFKFMANVLYQAYRYIEFTSGNRTKK
ncbi:MAG: hypothetical protein ACK5MK_04180 [Dysgonomonas sp.]